MNTSASQHVLLEQLLPALLLQALQQPAPPPTVIAEASAHLEAALSTVRPFVPQPVLDARVGDSGNRISSYRSGTVLFADLSGFTALSSRLSTTGRQGSEEISTIINQIFAALVHEINTRGGWVAKFGGDAITAVFEASQPGSAHAVHAAAAGLAMQARMADFAVVATSKGDFALHLRITIHSGSVFLAEVGDHTHTELIVTGPTLNRVMQAQQSAEPGETLLSSETLALLPDALSQQKRPGLHLLNALDTSELVPVAQQEQFGQPSMERLQALVAAIQVALPYMPYGLSQRLFQKNDEVNEFRPVTVLFANFYAFNDLLTLLDSTQQSSQDTTAIGQIFNTCYIRIQEIIHRFGGTINKVDMTMAGDRLMAVFGVPLAHEDAQARAVQAAIELRDTLDATDQEVKQQLLAWAADNPEQQAMLRLTYVALRHRIGIDSGTVFAGIVGTPHRHEYTVMGNTVNLAARLLETAGDGDILLPARTYYNVRHLLEAEILPPIQLKGFPLPIPVFRAICLTEPSEPLHRSAPMVGRDDEQEALLSVARAALTDGGSAGQVIALVGQAGIGKTRLANEGLTVLEREFALTVVRDTCQSYEQHTPYLTVNRLLRQLLLQTQDATEYTADLYQQVEQLAPEWVRFVPLLGPLLQVPIAETALTRALTPEQHRDRLHDLVVAVCLGYARHTPLVCVINDVQWLDASSRLLIERLARELVGTPMLLLLIYRQAASLAEPWCQFAHTTTITLNELTPTDSETLVTSLIKGSLPPEVQPFVSRAYGTPFYLEEIMRYLVEARLIQRNRTGEWVCLDSALSNALPAQIEQLLVARLDRLPSAARTLAQVAAIFGTDFSADLLAAVADPLDDWRAHIDTLVSDNILLATTTADVVSYHFSHNLLQDVAYNTMLFARRQSLHEQVASAIEQHYADHLDAHRVVVAQHYQRADQPARAFPHYLAAAQQAQARYANDEALTLYNQAIVTAPWQAEVENLAGNALAIMLYENKGDILALMSDYVEARETYTTLIDTLQPTVLEEYQIARATIQRKIGHTFEQQGMWADALAWFALASQTLAAHSLPHALLESARISSDTGWVHFRQNDLEQAGRYLEQALQAIEQLASDDEQARIYNRLGGVAWTRGDMELAQQYVAQSLAASERSGDLIGQANTLANLGLLSESQGHFTDAVSYSRRAMEIHERIGNKRGFAIAALNLGWACYSHALHDEAHSYFTQARQRAAEVHDLYNQMQALLGLGYVSIAAQEWDQALLLMRQCQQFAVQLCVPAMQLESHVVLAEIALEQGRIRHALEEYDQAVALATEPETEEYGKFQRLAARIALHRNDRDQAIVLLQAAEGLFRQLQNVPEAERTHRLLAQLVPAEQP